MLRKQSSLWALIALFTLLGSGLVYFERSRPSRLPAAERDTLLPELWQYQFASFYLLVDGSDVQKGLLAKVYDQYTHAEKVESKDLPSLQSEEVKATIGYAIGLKEKVEAAMIDESLKPDVRRAILKTHLVRIVLKARDVVSLVWTEVDKLAKRKDPTDLTIPKFRRDLLPKDSDLEKAFQITLTGQVIPFEIVDLEGGWATFKFRFDALSLLARDLQILSGAPTIPHYARGLKLLGLTTMLEQLSYYSAQTGTTGPLTIPQGCRSGMSSGLPEKFEFKASPEEAQASAADGLISTLGLAPTNDKQETFFKEYVLTSPTQGVYAGYLPLERYRAAKRGLDKELGPEWEPPIDDSVHFVRVMQMRAPQAMGNIPERVASLAETAAKVLQIHDKDDESPVLVGHSEYTVEKMKKLNTLDWRDTVCPAAKTFLQSQKLKIKLPRWSAASTSMRWAFDSLYQFSARMVAKPDTEILNRVRLACPKRFCKSPNDRGPEAFLKELARILGPFKDTYEFVPPAKFYDEELKTYYPTLQKLWTVLRDSNLLADAQPTEWKYLEARLEPPSNPWAPLRLAYVTLAECDYAGKKSDLRYFGDPLGLSQPLLPDHANEILTREEKEIIWKGDLDELRKNTSFVSDVKIDRDFDVLDKLDAIFRHRPILDPDEADDVVKKLFGPSQASVRTLVDEQQEQDSRVRAGILVGPVPKASSGNAAVDALAHIFNTDEIKYAQQLRALYLAQGRKAEQEKIFKDLQSKIELNPEDSGGFNSKIAFLNAELIVKRPLYRGLFDRGARLRKLEVASLVRDLCNSDPLVNEREFKLAIRKLFALNEKLHKTWGLQEMPPNVKAELEKWSRTDKENLYLSGFQLAFFGAASLAAAGCTVGTGGMCAPVWALILSLGATGTQAWMAVNSTLEATDAGIRHDLVKAYAELGFSTDEAADQATEGHGWGMAAADMAFTLPLVGQTAKGVQVGFRMLPTAGKATGRFIGRAATLRNPFNGEYSAAVRSWAAEADLKASMYHLGIESVPGDLKKIARNQMISYLEGFDPELVRHLKYDRNPLARELWGRAEIDKLSEQFVIKKWAETVAAQFGGSGKYFIQEMGTYTGSRLVKFGDRLRKWEQAYGNGESANLLRKALYATGLPSWRMARLERAISAGRGLTVIIDEYKVWQQQGKTFEEFLVANQVELRRIFASLPVLKRELPTYVLFQGGPGVLFKQLGTTVAKVPGTSHYTKVGFGLPYVNYSAQSLLLKQASLALENVLWAKRMNTAYATLGLPAATTEAHNGFQLIQAFFESARVRIEEPGALKKVDDFQRQVAKRILKFHSQKSQNAVLMSEDDLVKALGQPELNDLATGAQARALFNSTPMTEVYNVPHLNDLADEVLKARSLQSFDNPEVLDELMTALHVASETAKPKPIPN